MPTFGSLFAGIGGIDLGLERAGWECRFQVEWNDFCQRVLAKHWPDVPRFGDIAAVDWTGVPPVDLLAGGFPCQPFSVAGKQRRLDDDRWLWPEFARAIRELRPRFVLVENVPGLLVGGGMDAVLGDLAALGYDAEWESIPAAAVGAPHLRYRVWIVAYANGGRRGQRDAGLGRLSELDPLGTQLADASSHRLSASAQEGGRHSDRRPQGHAVNSRTLADATKSGLEGHRRGGGPSSAREEGHDAASRGGDSADVAHADISGWDGRSGEPGPRWRGEPANGGEDLAHAERGGQPRPRQPLDALDPEAAATWEAAQSVDGGVTHQWSVEPDVGRVAHGVPARVDRLRSLGNAVVPQVVEVIGRRILEASR